MMADEKATTDDLNRCVEFHGHLCPGLSIGIQACRALLDRLGETRSEDGELVAVVETDACGSDAVQVLTGCTFGKGNFFFRDFGKHAFMLGSRKSGRGVRVCLKPGAWSPEGEHAALFDRMRSATATLEEKERFSQFQEEAAKRILAQDPGALFKIEEISVSLPPKARVVRSEVCDRCGEPVKIDFLENMGSERVCPACRGKQHRTG